MSRPVRVLSLYEGFFAGGARILHTDVVAGLHAGGDQQHRVLSLSSVARRDASVQHLHRDPRYLRLVGAGVGVRTLGRTAGSEAPDPSSFTERELRIAADELRRADVVLSLKEQPLALLLALEERGLMPDVPVAACLHRSDPLHSGRALTWLADVASTGLLTAAVSCAESTSTAYAPFLDPGTRRLVVPNGIDTDRFRPADDRERDATRRMLGIPGAAPVVVFAARFDAMKNPRLFLESVAIHARRRPGTRYVLCGAGMDLGNEAFRALLRECGLEGSGEVHALGIRDDMPAIYGVADIVALTSAFGEASPLCLLEGAACGATPVTTDVGDAARSVEGIGVVTAQSAGDIAAAWDGVLDRRVELRDLALAARARVGRDRMIGEYRDVVGSLLERDEVAA
jgi:glycosyltransferase involved in cell wall biosynthesis